MIFASRSRSNDPQGEAGASGPARPPRPRPTQTSSCFRILRSEEDVTAARERVVAYERARAEEATARYERHRAALERAGLQPDADTL